MAAEIPKMFDALGPQLNTFLSVEILFLSQAAPVLLQFEGIKKMSKLVMSRFL